MTLALQMPVRNDEAIELSKGLWRKQVLKKGTINYKGDELTFGDAEMAELAQAFREGAYDQVAFQLATDANQHTANPEQFRGEVRAVIPTETGLDALIETTDAGSELIKTNPKLGVSCRLVPERENAGRKFKLAIEHVLGTLNPVVTGMTGWQAIALSNESTTVVDLTAAPYQKEPSMAELSSEQRAAFDQYVSELAQLTGTSSTEATGDVLDAELEALLAQALAADEAERVGASTSTSAELSADTRQAIELATAQAEAARQENAGIRAELDLAKFAHERTDLVAKGIPPAIVDLAMPLLLGSGHAIELANGTQADAGDVMRKVLHEIEGLIDFSAEHLPASHPPANDKTKALLDQWQSEYGGTVLPASQKS